MKTTTRSLNLSRTTLKILPALTVAITAAWLTQPVFGTSEPTLTLTEVSNTQLNWAWDAAGGGSSGSIFTATPDSWQATTISGPNLSIGTGSFIPVIDSWTEPEDAGLSNLVDLVYTQDTSLNYDWSVGFFSDLNFVTGQHADGDVSDIGNFNIKVVDRAGLSEGASVPDTGTTGSLFGFSLAGLVFLRRKLSC